MDSDQTTLQKDTGSISLLRGARTRVTSIQGRGEAGSVLLLHDTSDATTAAGGNLKATSKQGDFVVIASLENTDHWQVTQVRGTFAKES